MHGTFKSVGWAMLLFGSSMITLGSPVMTAQAVRAQDTEERKAPAIAGLCRNLQPQFMLTGHLSPVVVMAVSADSKTLVSGDENGVVNGWSLETGQLLHSLAAYPGAVKAVAITPDGKSIVSLVNQDEKDSVVSVWSLETGQLVRSFEIGRGEGKALAISPDGKSIVSASHLRSFDEKGDLDIKVSIKVWSLQTGELIQSVTKRQDTAQTLDRPEPQTIIRVGEMDKENSYDIKIEFLNRMNGNIIQPNSPVAVQGQFNGDFFSTQNTSKKITATVSVRGVDGDISFITLQDLITQKTLCTIPKPGQVQSIIFSPDGQRLIIAGRRIEVIKLNSAILRPDRDRSEYQPRILHLNRLGQDKLKRKQYYSAERHFWQAFELNRQLGNEPGQIDALYNIAEAKYTLCQVAWNSCRTDYQGLYELLLPYFQAMGDRDRAIIAAQRKKSQEES